MPAPFDRLNIVPLGDFVMALDTAFAPPRDAPYPYLPYALRGAALADAIRTGDWSAPRAAAEALAAAGGQDHREQVERLAGMKWSVADHFLEPHFIDRLGPPEPR